jgi:hypothetical protein
MNLSNLPVRLDGYDLEGNGSAKSAARGRASAASDIGSLNKSDFTLIRLSMLLEVHSF